MEHFRQERETPANGAGLGPGSPLVSLDDAAGRLDLSRQDLMDLVTKAGVPIQRVDHGGRTVSAVDRLDLHRALPRTGTRSSGLPAASLWAKLKSKATRGGAPSDETVAERLREVETELAQVREQLRLSERGNAQRARLAREAEVAEARIGELSETIAHLESELSATREQLDLREAEVANLRGRGRTAYDSPSEELEGTGAQQGALERELELAREVEPANQAYLDRLEAELSTARQASAS